MSILARFEVEHQDYILVAVVGNHNILVATIAVNGKLFRVVRVQAYDVAHVVMEFSGRFFLRHRVFGVLGIVGPWLGRMDALTRLNHVSHNGCIGVGTVLGGVVVGDPCPSIVVAGFYGPQLHVFDGEAYRSV